jgi:hypothetical protein
MKKILLKIYTWFFWKHFCWELKSVLGHKTLSASIKEMNGIDSWIRNENELSMNDTITWENSKKTGRELFAKYVTLKHFNEVGKLLVFFRSVEKKRILGVN